MGSKADEIRVEALSLSMRERSSLARDLLESLDDPSAEADQTAVDRVWADEVARRAAQIDSGDVVTQSWDEVMSEVARSRSRR